MDIRVIKESCHLMAGFFKAFYGVYSARGAADVEQYVQKRSFWDSFLAEANPM